MIFFFFIISVWHIILNSSHVGFNNINKYRKWFVLYSQLALFSPLYFIFYSSYRPKLTGGPKVAAHTAGAVSYNANSRWQDYLFFLSNVTPYQPVFVFFLSNITWPCKACAPLWDVFYSFRVRRRDLGKLYQAHYASRVFLTHRGCAANRSTL